ncbi:MAG TPA: S24/S26 family peptidase [Candidatus Binataceae bacterium]|nr:S24/S26 family peptidase [Candidatus Binataceae bacterium]
MTDSARSIAIGELLLASLRAGHAIRIRANGTSMLPAIWPGDVLTVAPSTAATPAPGDVALTLRDGRWVAHRVLERRAHGGAVALITRGDALDRADPIAVSTEILGIVVARNGQPIASAPTARTRWLMKLADRVVRSAPLLALTLKLRALARRLVPATV